MIKKILVIFIIFVATLNAEDKFEQGIDYELMHNDPSSYELNKIDKILVIEAFWYGCPHCFVFEEFLSDWKNKDSKDVNFINMPAVFNKPWLLHARAFYTMHALDNFHVLHKNFFYAYHKQQRTFSSMESIMKFFDSQGVDTKKATKIFSSKDVSKKVQEANYILETYKIDSVPAVIINDKYKISGRMAKTYARMIEISDYIIELERSKKVK